MRRGFNGERNGGRTEESTRAARTFGISESECSFLFASDVEGIKKASHSREPLQSFPQPITEEMLRGEAVE